MAAKTKAHVLAGESGLMAPVSKMVKNRAYISGRWVPARAGDVFTVTNPATDDSLADVPDFKGEDVILAIDAAAKAFEGWSALPTADRAKLLSAWAALIDETADDLALLMTLEQGKPLTEARGEVKAAAATIQWCAEEGRRLYGDYLEGAKPDTHIVVSRRPIGVAAAITPWNFPVGMITRKVGPALAAGCTVVLKPSELTPLCALALADLAEKAGIPGGVFNVITTTDAAAAAKILTGDARVRKISFTGSTPVGKSLMAAASANLQKISLELGGNAPFIVMASADLEKAVDGAIASKFRNAGQTCICANRIFVHDAVYNVFKDMFLSKIKALKVGNGWEDGVSIGPLIDDKAMQKVKRLVQAARDAGAQIIAGGNLDGLGGRFYQPTLMEGVPDDSALFREEIFGPVAVLYRFSDTEEVIKRANNTPYGLAAYVYTNHLTEGWKISARLAYGMVAVNEPMLATDLAPFGGIKESGIGREGGKYGLLEYTEMQYRLFH